MQKTYSQKVARVFEILCYVLLVPAFISLIYPFVGVVGGIASGRAEAFFISLIPFLIAAPGVGLLVGYFKHSRGRLSENRVSALWTGTAVYNFLLLLPWLFFAAKGFESQGFFAAGGNSVELLFRASIVWGYIAAIVFSLKAYSFEKRQKYI